MYLVNLDGHASVYQDEVRTIMKSVQALLEGDRRSKPVVIYSDSLAVLRPLDCYLIRPSKVLRGRVFVGELTWATLVSLMWLSEHSAR